MSYPPPLAAALSGVSPGQLQYWRRDLAGTGPLLMPAYGVRPRVAYSYQDVIALRMFAQLRQHVSLQKIRKAVAWLSEQHPDTHLSAHQLRATPGGRTIVWIAADGNIFDVVEHPGQQGIGIVMQAIFAAFDVHGRPVPDLVTPAPGLMIDPQVRGGVPVARGTRLPYHLIAGLTGDGLDVAAIRQLYPAVTAEAVRGAAEFSGLVSQWGRANRAA